MYKVSVKVIKEHLKNLLLAYTSDTYALPRSGIAYPGLRISESRAGYPKERDKKKHSCNLAISFSTYLNFMISYRINKGRTK